MREMVGDFTQQPVGPTYFQGSRPIDGVWVTLNTTVCNTAIMPAGYGIGDCTIYLSSNSLRQTWLGYHIQGSWWLSRKIPRVAAEYVRILEDKVICHRLIKRMGAAHRKSRSKALATARFNCLDRELGQCMRHAEMKCQKIKSGWIPFSPKAS